MHNNNRYNCRVYILNRQILLIRPKVYPAEDKTSYHERRFFASWDIKTNGAKVKIINQRTEQNFIFPTISMLNRKESIKRSETTSLILVTMALSTWKNTFFPTCFEMLRTRLRYHSVRPFSLRKKPPYRLTFSESYRVMIIIITIATVYQLLNVSNLIFSSLCVHVVI